LIARAELNQTIPIAAPMAKTIKGQPKTSTPLAGFGAQDQVRERLRRTVVDLARDTEAFVLLRLDDAEDAGPANQLSAL
jgi:hypothetical protein